MRKKVIFYVFFLFFTKTLFCLPFNNYQVYKGYYFSILPSISYKPDCTHSNKVGYGIESTYGYNALFARQSLLEVNVKSHYHTPDKPFIQAYIPTTISILTGYRFGYLSYTCSPKLGPSYTVHYMYSDTNGLSKDGYYENTSHFYFDPSITFELENRYEFSKKTAIIFSPGYIIAFEENQILHNFTGGILVMNYF